VVAMQYFSNSYSIGLRGMMEEINRFLKDEKAVTAIEYALIAAGIATAIFVVVWAIGQQLSSAFQCIANCLPGGS
jgi:pilus assembly protein Flp/PilA